MFDDREDAGHQLAEKIETMPLQDPIVLGIPNGGVPLALTISEDLGFDFDVLFSQKLRHPHELGVAVGAISDDGAVYWHDDFRVVNCSDRLIHQERERQAEMLDRRSKLIRGIISPKPLEARSVIIVDDGVATGSSMIKAVQQVRQYRPAEVIVATPVASRYVLEKMNRYTDRMICLEAALDLWSIEQWYGVFKPVTDAEVLSLIQKLVRNEEATPVRQNVQYGLYG
jgi:predicted phosphoribosyltransferase